MGLELFNEISVEIDGKPFFSVENYHTYAVRQIRLVESFGQADAAGIAYYFIRERKSWISAG